MVNVEIIVGIIALGVIGAVFIPIAFDPKGEFDLIQCEENEIITFDAQGNAICDTVVPVGDGSGSFANENTEFRPHLVQGTNVQDPIIDFGGYQVRVLEYLPTQDGQTSWDYLVPEQYEAGEDLQWTLYWFKEDGVQDLSVIPHHYEEVTTCGETNDTVEILTVQDGVEFDFEEGESYLLMANTMWSGVDTDQIYQLDVRHGSTIFEGSQMIEEPVVAGSSPCNLDEDGYKYFWWTVWTPNATEATQNISIHATAQMGNLTATEQQWVHTSTDTAEEDTTTGAMGLVTPDLDLHDGGGAVQGHVGMRFQNAPMPQGATIINATIQFHVSDAPEEAEDPLSITLTGHDIDDSPAFTSTNSDISNRVETTASVGWAVPDWTTLHAEGADQRTPDLQTIIQEIVDRGGYVAGNDITILDIDPPDDQGLRHAETEDGEEPANAPEITVNYLGSDENKMLYDDITFTAIKLTDHFMEGVDYHYNQTAIEEPLGELVIPSGAWCDISSTICNTDWDNRFEITIDNTQVSGSGDHTDFPALVHITGTDFTNNLDDGADSLEDIRFLNSASDTLLDYEIEKFSQTDDELVAWVEIPTLDYNDDTVIYMYFDNAGSPTDQQNPS